jgi:hypothetical protein
MMGRFHNVDGNLVAFTDAEETARDAEEAIHAQQQADYIANYKYKDDRRIAYGEIGDELDMLYWDQVNDTTTFRDHVAAVKRAHPKP